MNQTAFFIKPFYNVLQIGLTSALCAFYFFGIFDVNNGILTRKAAKAAANRDIKGGVSMNQLSSKELMMLQDNIRMNHEMVQFLQTCSDIATDPQLKSICQQMTGDHRKNIQTLSRHIAQTTVQ